MKQLVEYIDSLTDIYGIADFNDNRDKLIETYGEDICKYPYAIAIGHKMIEEIIESIPQTYNDDKLAKIYLDEYRDSFQRVSKIANKIIRYIEDTGYHALLLDGSGKNEALNLKKPFSNKASANLAGIGWLGKNNLLTTKEFGPRLTWSTILTDAPLSEYAGKPMKSLCEDCTICVKACPGKAITDDPDPSISYSPQKCGEYIFGRQDAGHPSACGMCLYICPYGNKKVKKISTE